MLEVWDTDATRTRQLPTRTNPTPEPTINTVGAHQEDFPAATDDQYNRLRRDFISSIDLSAVCALASRHNHDKPCQVLSKRSGSFNVCFCVTFGHEGPQWAIRVPIEPAFDDPWDKLQSEVATVRYLESKTKIPVPRIHSYGRGVNLTSQRASTQMFIISDFIPGSLPPDSRSVSQLRIGPVISMASVMLRQPSRRTAASAEARQAPAGPFFSAGEYLTYQFRLVAEFFSLPAADLTVDNIKEEIFALNTLSQISRQLIDAQSEKGPFVLQHLDLRDANIIVDEDLSIRGIIDWEFAGTVPLKLFTPPSWITGHDPVKTDQQAHEEFRKVLDEKSEVSDVCDRLRTEWYGQSQSPAAFYVAHVLRRPTDLSDTFHHYMTWKHGETSLHTASSDFFHENPTLSEEARRQAALCERYTNYLRTNGLYETEIDKLFAESRDLKAKWGWQ